MPICVGPSASAVHIAPTLTLNSSTNYNENSGVLNATVTATGNKPITSVEFQWSTSATFASGNSDWTAASTNTLIPQGTANTARTLGVSLPNATNTTFYVRFRATNANGFVTTSSIGASFKTYQFITATFPASSTWTNPVPTSGTSGLAITSGTATVWGGGASSELFGGGGGGGGRTVATVSVGSSVSVTVGAGAAFMSNGNTSSFGSTSASGGNTGSNFSGGSSGNGNAGGTGNNSGYPYSGGGGGGAGGAGGNGTATTCGGGVGGDALDGRGRGAGGFGETMPFGTYCWASPSTNWPSGEGSPNSADGGVAEGGSGIVFFTYWGP
jgi:hypothetical protein